MSDIVERLRGWCPHENECPRVLIDEAADDIERLRAELAAAIKERDGLLRALEKIANQDYRGNGSNESLIAQRALAAMEKAVANA